MRWSWSVLLLMLLPASAMATGFGKGAFSCDFASPADTPLEFVPYVLERDRVIMSAEPGMRYKHIPLVINPENGQILTGGRYLFNSYANAKAYEQFVTEEYVLDGVQFLDRPEFINPVCRSWFVIGAKEQAPIGEDQFVMRTERFQLPSSPLLAAIALVAVWPGIVHASNQLGTTGVRLAYDPDSDLAELVYFAPRIAPPNPYAPDVASLGALAGATPLGNKLSALGFTKVFDLTQWVLTIWYPFEAGDTGEPSVWPQSPPFPAP